MEENREKLRTKGGDLRNLVFKGEEQRADSAMNISSEQSGRRKTKIGLINHDKCCVNKGMVSFIGCCSDKGGN